MKKINSVISQIASSVCLLAIALNAGAAPISPDQAIRIALDDKYSNVSSKRNAPVSSQASIVFTSSAQGRACYYIVNHGTDEGYTIVAADDNLPAILGYSDSGNFNASDIPENVKWWLESYTNQISRYYADPALQAQDVKRPAMRAAMKPIEPITKTKWNQDAPYNDQCPMDGSRRSVTGCVATAMAQVMKVYQWPQTATGSNAGVNFEGTVYQWNNMLDVYTPGQYNAAQANAVAVLMRQCGASVDMQYSADASGAYSEDVQYALYTYFGYSKGVRLEYRDYYSFTEWNQMVYDELALGRPVYYSGQASTGGHAFVCDGYRGNDYFHFNWGWGGAYDGYFLLNALNPGSGGIGSHEGGYNSAQSILTCVEKENPDAKVQMTMYSLGGFSYQDGIFVVINGDRGYNMIYNPHKYPITCANGLKITNVSDPSQVTWVIGSGGEKKYDQNYGFESISASIPSLPDGDYRITPAIKPTGDDWVEVPVIYADQTYVELNVSGGKQTLSNPPLANRQAHLIVNSVDYAAGMKGCGNFVMNIYVSNVGNGDYFGQLVTDFLNPEDDYFRDTYTSFVSLPERRTSVVQLSGSTSFGGPFMMYITDKNGNRICEMPLDLGIGDFPTNETGISAGTITPNFANTEQKYQMSTVVGNRNFEPMTVGLRMNLYKMGTEDNPLLSYSTQEVELPANQSITFATGEETWTIPAGSYYWQMTNSNGQYMTGPWPLKLVTGPKVDNGVTYYIEDSAAQTGYIGNPDDGDYKGVVDIANSYNGVAITDIEGGTFTFASELTSISLPAGIKKINPAEFYCADALETFEVKADTPFEISDEMMPKNRFPEVALSVPAGKANIYKRTDVWSQFLMPSWNNITYIDGCEYASGFLTDESGEIYAPYYVSPAERPVITINVPEGKEVFCYYTFEGDATEYGFWGGDGSAVRLPAIGRKNVSSAVFTTIPRAGVSVVYDSNQTGDVFDISGRCILRNATQDDIHRLPEGVYIYQGNKVLVK